MHLFPGHLHGLVDKQHIYVSNCGIINRNPVSEPDLGTIFTYSDRYPGGNAVMYIEGGRMGGPGYAMQTTPPWVFLPYIPETALDENRTG